MNHLQFTRAGRHGSTAQAVLFYNATDFAPKHVEVKTPLSSFVETVKPAEFLSSLDSDCCDICGNGSSETLICKDEVKIPT